MFPPSPERSASSDPEGVSIVSALGSRGFAASTGLPIRPRTARAFLDALDEGGVEVDGEGGGRESSGGSAAAARLAAAELDPGWTLARELVRPAREPASVLESSRWWPSLPEPFPTAIDRLWRHSVAVSRVALRLARERNHPEPRLVAAIGLTHRLGAWRLAAESPDRFCRWLEMADPRVREDWERAELGDELSAIARATAEDWGCDPRLSDAVWLHNDREGIARSCAGDPFALELIQAAAAQVERSPWRLFGPPSPNARATDAWSRILAAEIQSRCGGGFAPTESTPDEERAIRVAARLARRARGLLEERGRVADRLRSIRETAAADGGDSGSGSGSGSTEGVSASGSVRGMGVGRSRPVGVVEDLGCLAEEAWEEVRRLRDRARRTSDRLEASMRAVREMVRREESRDPWEKLDALAEFAAGAGHELNNPLMVISGRAQLLKPRCRDAESRKALDEIVAQARRAHLILRDLMAITRPPELRARWCRPDEILESVARDVGRRAAARGVSVQTTGVRPGPRFWSDPDALRHFAEILVANAVEACGEGASVKLGSESAAGVLVWTIADGGSGIGADEMGRLIDPFYCGRQAGRGLGLGLPRAARLLGALGGDWEWNSQAGIGTTIRARIPRLPGAGAVGARAIPTSAGVGTASGEEGGAPEGSAETEAEAETETAGAGAGEASGSGLESGSGSVSTATSGEGGRSPGPRALADTGSRVGPAPASGS